MPLVLYTCLFWLSTSGLWTVQAMDPSAVVSARSPHRGLAPTNVDFAFDLFQHLVAWAPNKNIFISPVSISMTLAMLSLGSGSRTRSQLLQGLGFNLTAISEAEIHQGFQYLHHLLGELERSLEMIMGNALFLDHNLELLESFSADIKHYYESEALATDFQDWERASREINEYVRNKTKGKIVDVSSDLDSLATLILVNYMFLKGTWAYPFDPENTKEKSFYVNETSKVKVPMMSQSRVMLYLHDSVVPCQVVQLNYVGNGTVFFILPDKGHMDTVIAALSRDTIQRWSTTLTLRNQVDLYIPKVSISGTYDLKSVLVDMGISDLFSNQANFSGITQKAPPSISQVIHKAMLQLDERGMAPTAPTKNALPLTSEPVTLRFDRPFLILIFDHFTWSTLFLGKVVNPA
uniref:Corticosteroid-binding globulin n=1 Tax=Jaculus jaculus TaxID=51337 RepID=A0A8C5KQF3_JACJA